MIQGFMAMPADENNWGGGVYLFGNFFKTGIVVIHQLPVNEDTLWLRVLGKGGTQKRAVEELVELPERNPFRFFVTWYGSIGGHKSTKSLSGKRLN
ncbi:hypothetical protein [Microcystis aeruginosa]|uniref:Uncharacterized protein n=1 Tax=Microcystis aeruginosa 11-30S32 TaxID=2358142 RepID=A0A510PPT2_MICAE|nr:hypothetical protein MAE30S32_45340 [Microcystis aeruginosa 11-30S32]